MRGEEEVRGVGGAGVNKRSEDRARQEAGAGEAGGSETGRGG